MAIIVLNLHPTLIHLVVKSISLKALWIEVECFYEARAKYSCIDFKVKVFGLKFFEKENLNDFISEVHSITT